MGRRLKLHHVANLAHAPGRGCHDHHVEPTRRLQQFQPRHGTRVPKSPRRGRFECRCPLCCSDWRGTRILCGARLERSDIARFSRFQGHRRGDVQPKHPTDLRHGETGHCCGEWGGCGRGRQRGTGMRLRGGQVFRQVHPGVRQHRADSRQWRHLLAASTGGHGSGKGLDHVGDSPFRC